MNTWIPVSDRLPTQSDANSNDDVLWRRSHWECLGKWDKVPIDATAWRVVR